MSWEYGLEGDDTFFGDGFFGEDDLFLNDADVNFSGANEPETDGNTTSNGSSNEAAKDDGSGTSIDGNSTDLEEENNKLRQYFNTLSQRVAEAEKLNENLKNQLESFRGWFKSSFFPGINSGK